MAHTTETLLAADLADRWIDAILSEEPALLLHADIDEAPTPEDMARNLAQFRAVLIDELAEQPIAYALDDDDELEDAEDELEDEPGADSANHHADQPGQPRG